jgi:hypothetical protein
MDARREHRRFVDLAQRIVQRQQHGRADIAAELIMRALATSDADHTFALALALAEQGLQAVEESRLDAAAAERAWQPAMRTSAGTLVTPADSAIEPIPLAMRLLDAMHRSMAGDKESAVAELGHTYEQASAAPDEVFHGMFAALATYAARCRNDDVDVTMDLTMDVTADATQSARP